MFDILLSTCFLSARASLGTSCLLRNPQLVDQNVKIIILFAFFCLFEKPLHNNLSRSLVFSFACLDRVCHHLWDNSSDGYWTIYGWRNYFCFGFFQSFWLAIGRVSDCFGFYRNVLLGPPQRSDHNCNCKIL